MLLSRLTSVTFFAAVGMITVVGLPIPDEYNLSPSAPTTDVRAPAVQLKISKRGDDEPQNTRPLEPKWSPAGPPNPLLRASSSTLPQKRPPPADEDVSVGGNRERLPPEASAVGNRERVPSGSTEGNRGQSSTSNVQKTAGAFPPGAYPPVFGWAGGRKFKLRTDYKENLRLASSEQIKEEIKQKFAILEKYYDDQKRLLDEQETHCGDDHQKQREISEKQRENNLYNERIKRLKGKIDGLLKDDFIDNKEFAERMKVLNVLVFLYNDDRYEKAKAQIEWIKTRLQNLRNISTEDRKSLQSTMERVLKRMPKFGSDLYDLGLAGRRDFCVGYLTEAYVEKLRAVT
ncbi:hypothetical protein C8R42DRAFT_720701 [Lentinula raphanica]|nr:hypothetical protein C8R42DRAFT_720701 [Lentinula raphanica]